VDWEVVRHVRERFELTSFQAAKEAPGQDHVSPTLLFTDWRKWRAGLEAPEQDEKVFTTSSTGKSTSSSLDRGSSGGEALVLDLGNLGGKTVNLDIGEGGYAEPGEEIENFPGVLTTTNRWTLMINQLQDRSGRILADKDACINIHYKHPKSSITTCMCLMSATPGAILCRWTAAQLPPPLWPTTCSWCEACRWSSEAR